MKQKLLTFLLLALLMPVVANADPIKVDGIYYNLSYNEAIVTNSNGGNPNPADPYVGEVVIPETVVIYGRTYEVKTIGLQAFYGSPNLTSIDIPASITKCDFSAFSSCWGLKRVNIHDFTAWCNINFVNSGSNPVYFANHLYLNGEEVTDVVIPSSITAINNNAFAGLVRMKRITIPNSVTSIGYYAFEYCDSLESVDIPNTVTFIGNGAFAYCHQLKSVTLPERITQIAPSLFDGCYELSDVVIPDSVTSIGSRAFYYNHKLDQINIPDGVISIDKSAFEDAGLEHIDFPNSLTTIGERAFAFCRHLQSLDIPGSVVSIGDYAFSYCNKFTSITVDRDNPNYDSRGDCNAIIETASNKLMWGCINTVIPNTVTVIGPTAFYRIEEMTSIEIPNSVVSIDNNAFYYCENMNSLTIPNSVTNIGNSAFEYCMSLRRIDIPNSVKTLGSRAFCYNTALTDLTIPASVESIGKDAFHICTSLANVTVDRDNPNYDSRENCNAIIETGTNTLLWGSVNAVIPNTVTAIADWAFFHVRYMNSIDIPNSVTSIGLKAFYSCYMSSVTIGDGVTSLGDESFRDCYNLEEVTIGNGLEFLPGEVFRNCWQLSKLTFGSAVDSIGSNTFYGCNRLTDVICLTTTPPKANSNSFSSYTATLSVPLAVVETYQSTYPWSEFENIVGILIGGDINGDGNLNVSDLTELINLMLNDSELPECGDVNGDGVVNVTDLTLLINKMLDDPN